METEVRRSAPAAAVSLAILAVTALFLARFEPARLLLIETARPAIAALVVLLAAGGFGRLATFRRVSDCIAAGFAILGTACAAVSLVDTRLAVALTIAAAFTGAFAAGRGLRGRPALPSVNLDSAAVFLLGIPALLAIVCAIAPVNSPDELVYKLAIPHDWILHGRSIQLPLSSSSYLVMALQSADVAALALGGGIAAKLAHLGLYFAAIAIVRRVGGTFAAVAVAWTPALMVIAGWAWSEWGVIALLVLSYEMWESDDVERSAIALGCAAASKYTALPWILAFGVVLLLRRRDALLRVVLLVTAFGGFFYVRNLVWSGSPVAPLLLPNAPAVEHYRGSGWEGLLNGADVFDARVADESLGIVLPVAAIAGLFAWKRRRDLVLIGAIQMPILLVIAPGSRNILNGVVPLAIAGAELIAEKALWSRVAKALIGVALGAQLVLAGWILDSYEMTGYLTGKADAAQYIANTRNFARPYAWIDRQTPPGSRVLLLGENRTYYLQRPFLAAGNLDGPRVAAWLAHSPTPEALRAELRRLGVSYVVIHLPWYRVGSGPMTIIEKEYLLQVPTPVHAVLMRYLATSASRVYRDREYVIYRCM